MIHDIETTQVVDMQGILTPILTQADLDKIELAKEVYLGAVYALLSEQIKNTVRQSNKLAILDLMNEFRHPLIETHLKEYYDGINA